MASKTLSEAWDLVKSFLNSSFGKEKRRLAIDGPVIVSSSMINGKEKYAIFLHPNYKDYGFCFTDNRSDKHKEMTERFIERK